ncbi:12-oxophytodienoate reductase [Phytophthora cinnamomi]|uniref:12-oxophytodienoate reductase n=2 Tax=Phytophthora cinnamomi TaxID=4785 RepID=UPI003559D814|nr:12-oxophytodienoate reductase [Phytophthora cinnamomi]
MASTAAYKIFTPLKLGDNLELKNRVVFGPLTRGRAGADGVPSKDNEIYYGQRVGAGLIISEGTAISEQGYGWNHVPACYTDAHVEGWKRVIEAVHKKGGKIFMQMWHVGRQGHSSFNPTGDVVSASAVRCETGHTRDTNFNVASFETPRALEFEEVAGVVDDYRHSAEQAKRAGFDGVEIHGANGYLIDQFLQSTTNKRTDKYGGSFENRARFLLEIVEGVKTVFPSNRIGVRLSPNGAFGGMGSEDNFEMFTYTMEQLSKHSLGYLAILDGDSDILHYSSKSRVLTAFDAKAAFKGVVIANNNYIRDTAEGVVRSGAADLVGFGRLYITNPDLAERFENDWPVESMAGREVYYKSAPGGKFYNDYPAYQIKNELDD